MSSISEKKPRTRLILVERNGIEEWKVAGEGKKGLESSLLSLTGTQPVAFRSLYAQGTYTFG